MKRPEVGDDILYTAGGGLVFAGKVTHVWNDGVINCVTFGDGVNDREPTRIRTSVDRDDSGERLNTWRARPATFDVKATIESSPLEPQRFGGST